jgi:protein-glutamine gamma-glutamyltransferase
MDLERVFRLTFILLAGIGFAGLVGAGALSFWLVFLGLTVLLLSAASASGWVSERVLQRVEILSPWIWNIFLCVALVGFFLDLLILSQDILFAGVQFLVVLMVIKLLTLRQRKDFMHLYAISLLELLASAALTKDLWYAPLFFVYLFVAIWALLLYHLRNEEEEERGSRSIANAASSKNFRISGSLTARFFWTTNAVAMAVFCVTLSFFFVIPRVGIGYFEKNRADLIRTSGFAEKVDLGVIGAVKLDPTVVMRVEFPDEQGPVAEQMRIYFRGTAYDTYDGRAWSNGERRNMLLPNKEGVFERRSGEQTTASRALGFRQEILREALDTTVLFGGSFLRSVKGNVAGLQTDEMGGIYLPYPASTRLQYSAFSQQNRLLKADREAVAFEYPTQITERFLQLPETSPRIAALADEITKQARTPYEIVQAVERHLRVGYRYSLDLGTDISRSPLEDFLFIRKTGYCEHYATAMVVLLRTLKIPARLATGFLPGEWNEFGHYYTVRQQDAHAWVEVYFPRSGWVTFDPTPTILVTPTNALLTMVTEVLDSSRLQWDRYVIRYSLRDQVKVLQEARNTTERLRAQVWGLIANATRSINSLWARAVGFLRTSGWVALPASMLIFGLGWLISVKLRRDRSRRVAFRGDSHSLATDFYGQMLSLLAAHGLDKSPGATPFEFARHIRRRWSEVCGYVDGLTELYCRIRFGPADLPAGELERARALLAGLRRAQRDRKLRPR